MGIIKEMLKKGVRKKGKIKSGNKLPISDIFFRINSYNKIYENYMRS